MKRGKEATKQFKAMVAAAIREGLLPENCNYMLFPERCSAKKEALLKERLIEHFRLDNLFTEPSQEQKDPLGLEINPPVRNTIRREGGQR